ncbi:hypothetical protein FPV25_03220 [Carnobacterium sp. PL17GRE32]|uniref:hypothetical protein n=1 Tax=Carnobacterium sp. PL17GRE32 TaxID=2592355 RepID=UPI0011EFEE52|nr:hypothetical protein [Carnobacterium sp. PL17GRE32]KAF3306040.1 hypothetical protein FPV25_03220 [Carnobacterium sp. PL17GRE32]
MTDVQFQQLLEAINNMNNGIPTWLSLLLGSILGIFSNISFDMYQNYKRKKSLYRESEQIKGRINKLLSHLDIEVHDINTNQREISNSRYLIDQSLNTLEKDLNRLILVYEKLGKVTLNLGDTLISIAFMRESLKLVLYEGQKNVDGNLLTILDTESRKIIKLIEEI